MGAAQRDPTSMADGILCLQHRRQRSPRGREYRQRVRELPARTGADVCHRPRSRRHIQERAHFQEYFFQDDWKVSDRLTINAGLRYTLNFPSTEINGQTAVFNFQTRQLDYPGTEPVRPLKKDNFGPRLGAVYRLTDKTIVSSGYGKVWIEMAGITTPFTTPNFPFLQTVSLRTLDNIAPAFVLRSGPTVTPVGATPTPASDRASSLLMRRWGRATRNSGTCRSSAN